MVIGGIFNKINKTNKLLFLYTKDNLKSCKSTIRCIQELEKSSF